MNTGTFVRGRLVQLVIDRELDPYGQFPITLLVDDKEIWKGWFTAREDGPDPYSEANRVSL